MTQSIELLDLMLHLDQRQGLEYAFISIRPNTRIIKPLDPAVLRTILEAIKAELQQKGICHGINKTKTIVSEVKRYLTDYQRIAADKTFYTFPIAGPTPPQKGDNGKIEILVDLKLKPGKIKDEKSGKIDYYDLGFSETLIHSGKSLVIIDHATPGVDGIDIFKQPIKAEAGSEERIPNYDRKTITCEDDPDNNKTVLKAAITGFLYQESQRGYFVDKDVLTKQVDFSTGNIEVRDFSEIDTTIKVSGKNDIMHDSVKPGFTLKAKEVVIDGNVGRGATIEGDNIIISGIVDTKARIIGRKIEIGKVVGAHIEGSDIKINAVLQNATVVGEQVRISTCMSSEVSGEEVFINRELRSGSVTASKFIFCQMASGTSHSTLTIDPFAIPSFLQNLEEQQGRVNSCHKNHQKQSRKYEKEQQRHYNKHQHQIDNFYRQVEELKKITLNEKQKKAIEQLLAHGKIDDIGKRLNFKLHTITRKHLETFANSLSLLQNSFAELNQLKEAYKNEENIQHEMEESHTRGLILIADESSGEMKICYRKVCLSPIVFNQNLLFCYDAKKNKIIALKKFGEITHQRLFTQLSPRALSVVNKFTS
ncbi:MAG: flagellar assembly protein A [Pseudomonadota bacterium]|nr:flagellar assembly protein A [Pseudomonadota bacterium]